ncbi:MAG: hypothetical protein ABI977_18755 [Acidobacteriota bacterium]
MMAYDILLRWLSPDESQAARHYQSLRHKLVELFRRRGVLSSVLDELADETLDRVGRKLSAGEVIQHPEPMAYLHGVADNVLREYWRKLQQQTSREIPLDKPASLNSIKFDSRLQQQRERQEREHWLECLDEYLKSLSPEEERLIRACYHDDARQQAANRRAAAERLNLEEGSLRARLHRIRQTLERKVRACVERRQK